MVEATYLHSENKGCGPRCMPFVPRNEGPRESIRSLLSLDFFLVGPPSRDGRGVRLARPRE